MEIRILANELQKREISEIPIADGVSITWVTTVEELSSCYADVYFDFLFSPSQARIIMLKKLLPGLVIVNAIKETLQEIGGEFVRINAWPGLLRRGLAEIVVAGEVQALAIKALFNTLRWKYKLVADNVGMISPRVIAMIINEAYFAWQEGVSTRAEIDLAMKTGTNYPYGPFEWCEVIGIKNIYDLLLRLSEVDERYTIADSLAEEAKNKAS